MTIIATCSMCKCDVSVKNPTLWKGNCSKCQNKIRGSRYREKHGDAVRLRWNKWRQENAEHYRGKCAEYRDKTREHMREQKKAYYNSNKAHLNAKMLEWYHANSGKEKKKERYHRNKPVELEKRKQYRISSVLIQISLNLRSRLAKAIARKSKRGSAVRDLGCTIPEFMTYIATKFQPGMSWDNWGRDSWHLDHIKPLASFDLTKRKQVLKALHFTNYQPLWAKDNLSKHARLDWSKAS